jgi:hypothetical protein
MLSLLTFLSEKFVSYYESFPINYQRKIKAERKFKKNLVLLNKIRGQKLLNKFGLYKALKPLRISFHI